MHLVRWVKCQRPARLDSLHQVCSHSAGPPMSERWWFHSALLFDDYKHQCPWTSLVVESTEYIFFIHIINYDNQTTVFLPIVRENWRKNHGDFIGRQEIVGSSILNQLWSPVDYFLTLRRHINQRFDWEYRIFNLIDKLHLLYIVSKYILYILYLSI